MKIFLIRHGETLENIGTLLMGRTDGELSQLGIEQAKKTGQALKDFNINYIYSSPLKRCLDTANLINESIKSPLKTHGLLMERDFGFYTNASAKEVNFDELDLDSEENKKAGVESLENIRMRIVNFISLILKEHKEHNIIIVTHDNPIRLFLGEFLNKTYQEILKEYKVHNCSINIFEVSNKQEYKMILLDDISHLK